MPRGLPNIVLIVMDTARADRLSCYGHGRPTSPNIDALAAEGALFESAYSAGGWTLPSHASLFTSRYPSAHGLNLVGDRLAAGTPTLAGQLKGLGYRTAGITNNSFIGKLSGLCAGFESFTEPGPPLAWMRPALLRKIGRRIRRRLSAPRWDLGARATARLATRELAADDGRPFFLFLNFMDAHQTYSAPAAYKFMFVNGERGRAERVNQDVARLMARDVVMSDEDFRLLADLYDGQLRYLDHHLGQLFDQLRRRGLLDDTIVILTSDHGENLGEHGLMGHIFSLYQPVVRVPLLIRYPEAFANGSRVSAPVSLVDVMPTLLDLLGAPAPEGLQGRSFLPGTEVREFNVAEYVAPQLDVLRRRFPKFDCSAYDRQLRAAIEGDWKLIWSSRGDHELYDLRQDPAESRNLIASRPDVARRLEEKLAAWVAANGGGSAERASDIDRDTLERLSGLGYI